MPVNLYCTQKVRGLQQEKVKYSPKRVEIHLKRTKHQCSYCGSTAVTVEPIRRRICGEPLGRCRQVVLKLIVQRLYCHCCHHRKMEHIPFLSHPKARLTKTLERTIKDSYHVEIQEESEDTPERPMTPLKAAALQARTVDFGESGDNE